MTRSQMPTTQPARIKGMLFGAAFGDALAAPVEFNRSVSNIRASYPPHGPNDIHAGQVTDDTQMMLAVAEALTNTSNLTPQAFERNVRRTFTHWLDNPENNRAPGMTCLRACEALKAGQPWQQATVLGSKGCGANMRVQPTAVLNDPVTRSGAAQLQAAMTHGHATALAASDLTAHALWLLLTGTPAQNLLEALQEYAQAQQHLYHHEWLGDLWKLTPHVTPGSFAQRGWMECKAALHSVKKSVRHTMTDNDDPCEYTGEGWIAEEAFATGLLCFLIHPDDPVRALQRAATTSGDSDSIACITGSLLGAHLGLAAFPSDWPERIEYSAELYALSNLLAEHPANQVWKGV